MCEQITIVLFLDNKVAGELLSQSLQAVKQVTN